MEITEQINEYIRSQSETKQHDLQTLHYLILQLAPDCPLWFLDGKNDQNKVVSNPNIGYGFQNLPYANGKTKAFYQVGISANTTGISVYILGIADKTYLAQHYGTRLGKASVSGYCIKFKSLKEVNIAVLEEAIRFGLKQ